MFARIMAVVLAVILLTTVLLTGVWWFTLRNRQIDARLDYLISEAEDIAYLAGNLSGDSLMDTIRDRDSATRVYLNRMAEKVNREFGAYIAVMDRGGNVMTNSRAMDDEDPEFMESLNTEEITEARLLGNFWIASHSDSCDTIDKLLVINYAHRPWLHINSTWRIDTCLEDFSHLLTAYRLLLIVTNRAACHDNLVDSLLL